MNQHLCERGKALRDEFRAVNFGMTLRERQHAIAAYFWHKQKCMDCNVTWLKGENETRS